MTDLQCLYPGDILPFTRKPLFIILDSNNSTAFRDLPKTFSQPVVVLCSPTAYPGNVKDASEIGNLFTLFLHSPLKGFLSLCMVEKLSTEKWSQCLALVTSIESVIADAIGKEEFGIGW